jgi:ADP-ribosyl-[dinitrogen reductase] hydrolase
MVGLEDRALAAFLGFALGDALGATVEFMTKREIAAQYGVHNEIKGGGWLRLGPGQVTDDTEMALALARSLARCGKLDVRDVCEEFAAWLRTGPADVGNTCRRGIRRYITQGTVEGPFFEGDAGNGAVMRILPIALASLGQPDRATAWSLAQGHITHHHPLSDGASAAYCRACSPATARQQHAGSPTPSSMGIRSSASNHIATSLRHMSSIRYKPYYTPILPQTRLLIVSSKS